jgi:hypothetical protein
MKKPPKVTRVEFADGKVVRVRQEGGMLLIEWKTMGGDWKALEPVALEPFVPEMTDVEQEVFALAGVPSGLAEAAWVEEYRSSSDMQRAYRRAVERDLLTGRTRGLHPSRGELPPIRGGRIANPSRVNQGAVVDFATITSTMPGAQTRLEAGDRIGIDVRTSEAVPEGAMWLRVGDELVYRAADGTIYRGHE